MSVFQLSGWVAAGMLSCTLTYLARRYALRKAILDVPCQRSSHAVPTPRGGGLAIMAVALGGIATAGLIGAIPSNLAIGIVGGGALVAWVGWMDDRQELPAHTRLLAHLAGSVWFLAWLGGISSIAIGPWELRLGLIGSLVAALACVWFVNLYNFMDGIDGLAGGQAVLAGTLGGVMLLAVGNAELAIVAFCIAAASAGFLVWNWAPAKVFMGDSGSGLLGFLFVAVAFASEAADALPFLAWLLILGLFFYDATVTLIRRILNGDRWREGHRLHAYQRVVPKVKGHGHALVSGLLLLITLPLAGVAWWLTIRPDLYLILLGGAAGVITVLYLAVERIAPMYPVIRPEWRATGRSNSPTLAIAERRASREAFENHNAGDRSAARSAVPVPHGTEGGNRPMAGMNQLPNTGT